MVASLEHSRGSCDVLLGELGYGEWRHLAILLEGRADVGLVSL
jgi:hypothetical protein